MPARDILRISIFITILLGANVYSQVIAPATTPLPTGETTGVVETPPPLDTDISRTRDVVLVLDNSTGIKSTDPQFLARQALTGLVVQMDGRTHLGIILFDQDVKPVVGMVSASFDNRESILAGFEQLDYTGTGSDIPAAMERAVFELKNNGRVDADKFIIFLTGSTVDTGDAIRDIERTGWLQDTLAAEASIAGIRIFGVAFAGAADFQLVQALAQSTSGRYYQLQTAEELQDALSNVSTDMQQAVVAALPETTGVSEPAFVEIPATESVENIVVPAPEQGMGREERLRSIIIIAAAVVLTITLVALIVLLIKRSREYKKGMQDTASEAYLQDIKGYTGKPSYKLGKKATMLGRVAGKDSGHLDFIVIPESTIGRRHATIEYKDYAYWIVDQGSINGTFVNDVRITSETRLKHRDRIRLHKFEFDFVMPDLEEAGMTKVSHTVYAGAADESGSDMDDIKPGISGKAVGLDFDFSGADPVGEARSSKTEDETLLPGYDSDAFDATDMPDDETLMPAPDDKAGKPERARAAVVNKSPVIVPDDETLMPGHFDDTDDEATIRPGRNSSSSDVFDVTGSDDKD